MLLSYLEKMEEWWEISPFVFVAAIGIQTEFETKIGNLSVIARKVSDKVCG